MCVCGLFGVARATSRAIALMCVAYAHSHTRSTREERGKRLQLRFFSLSRDKREGKNEAGGERGEEKE